MKKILELFNLVPVSYTFASRVKTPAERISWLIIFPLFLSIVSYLNELDILVFFFCFLGTVSVYEIGYINNDFVTTKNEINPTIRHKSEKDWFFQFYSKAKVSRYILAFISFIMVALLDLDIALLFSIGLIGIHISFLLHNNIRNRFNIISYFLLVSLRYLTPIVGIDDINQFFIIILIFPLCRTIEHSCKIKYKFEKLQRIINDFDVWRFKYYLFILIVFFILYTLGLWHIKSEGVLVGYFLIYRTLALILSKNKHTKRNKHQSYK